MSRTLVLVLAIVVTAACHRPSLTGSVKSLGTKVGKMGGGIVAVVKPVAPRIDAHVDAATIAAVAADHAQQHAATIEPVTIHKTVNVRDDDDDDRAAPSRTRPAPAGSQTPTVVTTKRTVAPPPVFVLRSTTRNGVRSCSKFSSMEECTSTCTNYLKMDSMRTDPDALQSCNCMESSGC